EGDSYQPAGDQIEESCIGGVKHEIREMIASGVDSPNQIIQPVGHPTQRLVGSHVKRGEHPAQLIPSQAAVARVVDQVVEIVPVDELVPQYRQKGYAGYNGYDRRDGPVAGGLGQKAFGQVA